MTQRPNHPRTQRPSVVVELLDLLQDSVKAALEILVLGRIGCRLLQAHSKSGRHLLELLPLLVSLLGCPE